MADYIRPTPRNPFLGGLADLLEASTSPERTQQMQGIMSMLGVPAVASTLNRMSYGAPLTSGAGGLGGTTRVLPDVLEAAMTVAPMAPAAGQLAKRAIMATKGLPVGASTKAVGGIDFLNPTEYRGSHKAPGPDFGAPLHDLTGGGQMYPADVYSAKAAQYYGTGYPNADKEAFALAQRVRGNPDAEITMYRAVPKDENITNINAGDWVSLSKDYAKTHGESALRGDYKILSEKVKAKDLWTNADSIHEFGYQPQNQTPAFPIEQGLPSPQSLTMPSVPTVEQMQQYGRTEVVPLSKAVSFQSARNWDKFNAGKGPGDLVPGFGDKPLALRLENGEYVIYDGNHRTDLAIQKGQTGLPMNVIDVKSYDPAHAGRKPVPDKMSADDLLSALFDEVQPQSGLLNTIAP